MALGRPFLAVIPLIMACGQPALVEPGHPKEPDLVIPPLPPLPPPPQDLPARTGTTPSTEGTTTNVAALPPPRRLHPLVVSRIGVTPTLEARMNSGLRLDLELVEGGGRIVGACTVVYDLWNETFKVRSSIVMHIEASIAGAMRRCLDSNDGGLPVTSPVTARER